MKHPRTKTFLFVALAGIGFTFGLDHWFIQIPAVYLGWILLAVVGFCFVYVNLLFTLKRKTKRRFLDQVDQKQINSTKL